MRAIVKVDIRTYQIQYKVGVYIMESESIAIRNGTYRNPDWNTGRQCVRQGKHRNAMSENGTGTGTRIGTGTERD